MFKKFYLSLVALLGLCGAVAVGNYNMTQGAGTAFGSIVVGGTVHYAQQLICDYVTPSQCANVSAGGAIKVDGSAVTQPVSSATLATAANQTSQITQETNINTALGTTASSVCGSATGTCDITALIKFLNTQASTPLNNSSVAINVSTATTTQLVALSGSTVIYVTSYDVIAGGTGNITFVYGTGVNCGTGTTSLTGPYNLTAQAGISKGSGIGTILKVPSGNALCVTTSAAVQMSGSVSYQQF
jgi:hypothetical protein